jgi:hypothetical protein
VFLIVGIVLVSVILVVILLKLNSTPWFEKVVTPLRIGFVYISVVSMLALVNLRWPGDFHSALLGLQISLFKLNSLQSTACVMAFTVTFHVALLAPFMLAVLLLAMDRCATEASKTEPGDMHDHMHDIDRDPDLGLQQFMTGASAEVTAATAASTSAAGDHGDPGIDRDWVSGRRARALGQLLGTRAFSYLDIRMRDPAERKLRLRSLMIKTFLGFLSSSYTYLAWVTIELFVCTNDGHLRADGGIVCFSSSWYPLLPTACFGFVFYIVGIPALQLYLLRRFDWGEGADAAAYLGYRITGYRRGFRWWDTADMIWRLSVALSIQLLMETPDAQIAMFTSLVAGRLVAQRRLRPFVDEHNNVHEGALQWLTLGVMLCGVLFYCLNSQLNGTAQAFLFVLAAAFLAGIGLSLAYSTVKAFGARALHAIPSGTNADAIDREPEEGKLELVHRMRALATGLDSTSTVTHWRS